MGKDRKKKSPAGLVWLILLLVLVAGTMGARLLTPGAEAPTPATEPPVSSEPTPESVLNTEPPASATPSPEPEQKAEDRPEDPAPTEMPAQPAPEPDPRPLQYLPQGNSDETRRLISDMVFTYAQERENGLGTVESDLTALEAADPLLGKLWRGIMDQWRYVNTDLAPTPGQIPEGLAEDGSLCIVVLGFQLNGDGTMMPELQDRCEMALRCAERYPQALIALTGGGTAWENKEATEAGVMADWFRQRGIGEERLVTETRSLTTGDNAAYLGGILLSEHPEVRQLLLVTSDYHLPLGLLLFEEQALLFGYRDGLKPFTVAGWAVSDTGMRLEPESPPMQKQYLWSLADPEFNK